MLKYGCVMSGLLGPISSSEREPAFADLSGRRRISGFRLQTGLEGREKILWQFGLSVSAPLPSLLGAVSDKSLKFPYSLTAFLSFDK